MRRHRAPHLLYTVFLDIQKIPQKLRDFNYCVIVK